MKTKKEITDTFSKDEIEILIDSIRGNKDFDEMVELIYDF